MIRQAATMGTPILAAATPATGPLPAGSNPIKVVSCRHGKHNNQWAFTNNDDWPQWAPFTQVVSCSDNGGSHSHCCNNPGNRPSACR